MFEWQRTISFLTREHKIHIFELPCNVLFIIWIFTMTQFTVTIKINVLIVKNSFLTKMADAKTRYKTQHTSQHLRKTNEYIKSLKCLLASTCFVFLFNSIQTLNSDGHFENNNNKKGGNVSICHSRALHTENTPLGSRM